MKVHFRGIKQSEPTRHGDISVSYGPAKRIAFRWRWYFMLLLILSPVAFFSWQLLSDHLFIRAQGFVTTEPVLLRASQSGFVTTTVLLPGERVKANQIVINLSSPEIDRKLEVLNSSLTMLKGYQCNRSLPYSDHR